MDGKDGSVEWRRCRGVELLMGALGTSALAVTHGGSRLRNSTLTIPTQSEIPLVAGWLRATMAATLTQVRCVSKSPGGSSPKLSIDFAKGCCLRFDPPDLPGIASTVRGRSTVGRATLARHPSMQSRRRVARTTLIRPLPGCPLPLGTTLRGAHCRYDDGGRLGSYDDPNSAPPGLPMLCAPDRWRLSKLEIA
jgi:hypothetical protein